MTRTRPFHVALVIGCLSLGVGCAGAPEREELTLAEQAARGLGYYEVKHDGAVYVVGSTKAAAEVAEGKLPKQTVVRYSQGGTRVLIDVTDPVDGARLTHEYDRRHRAGM